MGPCSSSVVVPEAVVAAPPRNPTPLPLCEGGDSESLGRFKVAGEADRLRWWWKKVRGVPLDDRGEKGELARVWVRLPTGDSRLRPSFGPPARRSAVCASRICSHRCL